MASWGYTETDGPERWHDHYPVAKEGKRQSPIDIATATAESDSDLTKKPLRWSYVSDNVKDIENTGASWKVNTDGAGSCLSGGALEGEYELWQLHAHWGSDDDKGSEHTVDGKAYAGELHLVHWNKSKYASPNEAAGEPDGLAVLGLFLDIGDEHPELSKITSLLGDIRHKGDRVNIPDVDCSNFLPKDAANAEFFTYEGSLTTPPLLESVIWTVFKEPMKVSKEQMEAMRSMKCSEESCSDPIQMVNNYRPPCHLGNRTVRKN